MGMKIKVMPRKSGTLCNRCVNSFKNRCKEYLFDSDRACEGCPVYFGESEKCLCLVIKEGNPCPFFKRYKK